MFKKLKSAFILIITAVFTIKIIQTPEAASKGAAQGINFCLEMLIPSLFIFMFLAAFIVNSGISRKLQKTLSPITKFLFYLPGCTAPVIILSLIGGYPVGARGAKTLFLKKEINEEQLNRLMSFSVNAGPAFIINIVGKILTKNYLFGQILFFTQILFSFFISLTCGLISKIKKRKFYEKNYSDNNKNIPLSDSLILSCEETSKTMVNMCSLVVLFCTAIELIQNLNIYNIVINQLNLINISPKVSESIIASVLEITSGSYKAAKLNAPLTVTAFAVGYGGICAHLQIKHILRGTNFNYLKFCTIRFFNGIATAFLAVFILNKMPEKYQSVFSTLKHPILISNSATKFGSIVLICFCIYFIFSVSSHMHAKK
ncbi:MAG: hypothetical protein IJI84_02405 [Clostridia bacterium]|nr:hypothetical protein [Clostridia bacterium]